MNNNNNNNTNSNNDNNNNNINSSQFDVRSVIAGRRRKKHGWSKHGWSKLRTALDVPKPKYCGAPNLCEDLY